MQLTTENAHEYAGKKLYGGPFHYWPLTVYQTTSGRWMVADRNQVATPVPDAGDQHNAIYFSRAE